MAVKLGENKWIVEGLKKDDLNDTFEYVDDGISNLDFTSSTINNYNYNTICDFFLTDTASDKDNFLYVNNQYINTTPGNYTFLTKETNLPETPTSVIQKTQHSFFKVIDEFNTLDTTKWDVISGNVGVENNSLYVAPLGDNYTQQPGIVISKFSINRNTIIYLDAKLNQQTSSSYGRMKPLIALTDGTNDINIYQTLIKPYNREENSSANFSCKIKLEIDWDNKLVYVQNKLTCIFSTGDTGSDDNDWASTYNDYKESILDISTLTDLKIKFNSTWAEYYNIKSYLRLREILIKPQSTIQETLLINNKKIQTQISGNIVNGEGLILESNQLFLK